eukprot:Hpha_TRINITY_DN5158_c0_g2::TRINITY_DN5158_c0_g2_i1::g.192909::m.192909
MRIKYFWGDEGCINTGGSSLNCYCKSVGDTVPDFSGKEQTCTAAQVLTTELRTYIDGVMGDAVAWLSSALLVDPVSGPLKTGDLVDGNGDPDPSATPYCGASNFLDEGILTPAGHHTAGVPDADFLVYVSAVPTGGN